MPFSTGIFFVGLRAVGVTSEIVDALIYLWKAVARQRTDFLRCEINTQRPDATIHRHQKNVRSVVDGWFVVFQYIARDIEFWKYIEIPIIQVHVQISEGQLDRFTDLLNRNCDFWSGKR